MSPESAYATTEDIETAPRPLHDTDTSAFGEQTLLDVPLPEVEAAPVPAPAQEQIASGRRWRLDRIGYAVTTVAALTAATVGGVDQVLKYQAKQAEERSEELKRRSLAEAETRRIDFIRGGLEWRLIRARRAVAAWQKHGAEMDTEEMAACLHTIRLWMEDITRIHEYETANGRIDNITMYHVLEMPSIRPVADEIQASLVPPAAAER